MDGARAVVNAAEEAEGCHEKLESPLGLMRHSNLCYIRRKTQISSVHAIVLLSSIGRTYFATRLNRGDCSVESWKTVGFLSILLLFGQCEEGSLGDWIWVNYRFNT